MENYEFPAYAESLLNNIQKLRRNNNFCDINLNVHGSSSSTVFPAHKVVLSSASPYFKAMFTGGMQEESKTEVDIHGINCHIFAILMEFIYSGKIKVDADNVQDILAAANMLSLPDAVSACCSFMKSQLDPSNCLGIRQFAALHSCRQLMSDAEAYTHKHFSTVSKEEEFMKVTKEELLAILESEDLCIETELQVLAAAVEWILYKPTERRKFVVQILESVRSALIPPQLLLDYVHQCQDLILKVALQKLLADHWHPHRKSMEDGRLPAFSLKGRLPLKPRKASRKHLIYLVGGYCRPPSSRWSDTTTLDSVSCFDALTGLWTEQPGLLGARSGHGVASLDGALYVVGGESDLMIYDSVEVFEPAQGKWSLSEATLTVPRSGAGVVAVDGTIYSLGGWIGSEMGNSVERYDPEAKHWSVVTTRMPTPRYSFGIVEMNGLIYCIGGISEEGTELDSCDCFDPVSEEWLHVARMRTSRAYVGAATLNGCLYAVGGWNSVNKTLNTVEKYSPLDKRWVSVKAMGMSRAGAAVAAVNGLLYVMGGKTSCNSEDTAIPFTLDTVEYYEPNTDCWTQAGTMPNAMCEGSVAIL